MLLSQRLRLVSRICFYLLWIPFITLFIGMAGMPNGSYDWVELPLLARYSLVGVGVFAAGIFASLIASLIVGSLANRSVLARGVRAEAVVLSVSETGTYINRQPLVRLVLEVRPSGGPPFQAQTETVISLVQIPQVQPGAALLVKYDPATQAVALLPASQH